MNEIVLPVTAWLADSGLVQLANRPVNSQIQQLESAGSGFGFVFIGIPTTMETINADGVSQPDTTSEQLEIEHRAIFKVRGVWYTIVDDNISDIACAIARIIAERVSPPSQS